MIRIVEGAPLSAEVRERAGRHPLGVAAHVVQSIAVTAAFVAVPLMLVGGVLGNSPTFFAGSIITIAAAALSVCAHSLSTRAIEASTRPSQATVE